MLSSEVKRLEEERDRLKNEIEIMKRLYGDGCKPMRCQECMNFVQHYIKAGVRYIKINEGHCVAGKRNRNKKTEDERCQFFQERR